MNNVLGLEVSEEVLRTVTAMKLQTATLFRLGDLFGGKAIKGVPVIPLGNEILNDVKNATGVDVGAVDIPTGGIDLSGKQGVVAGAAEAA
jgi:hypothetical protein